MLKNLRWKIDKYAKSLNVMMYFDGPDDMFCLSKQRTLTAVRLGPCRKFYERGCSLIMHFLPKGECKK